MTDVIAEGHGPLAGIKALSTDTAGEHVRGLDQFAPVPALTLPLHRAKDPPPEGGGEPDGSGTLGTVNSFHAALQRIKGSLPPVAIDVGLTLIGEASVIWGVFASQNGYDAVWPWWVWVLSFVIPLPLLLRRQAAFAAWLISGAVIMLLSFASTHATNYNHSTEFSTLVLCATVAYLGSTWQYVTAFALSVAGAFATLDQIQSLAKTLITALTLGLAFAIGRLAAKQRLTSVLLAERVREAERTTEARAAEAAAEERTRIARDMHDILAHAVSLIVVQAEAGGAIAKSAPDTAEGIFDAIGDTGRDALVQLRRMLGVLRDDDALSLTPQPTIAALPRLIESVRSTEIDARLFTQGVRRALPADAEIAVYRTVQESLTNVVKHAKASRVQVQLDWRENALAVYIADDGIGPRTPERGRTTTPAAAPGRGLIGIHERISSCGGSVAVGAGPDGRGFQLTATLPLEPLPT